ncbi:MAG: alpha-2-macroglobulin family protein [Paludibacter sp.]|nr:alpha-2-macroglobulin family protein [Paludibacter sp.]
MKKTILFVILISLIFTGYMLAAKEDISLAKRWEKVNELAEKQLPESALKEVEVILAQAGKEKNSVEVIKAMVYKMRFALEKNPDEAPALIKDFEAFTLKSTDPAERALLHSMTAELYAQYYQKDQWTINNRTEITGLVPEDMKEWTKNIYFDKITRHLAASLENRSILQKTDALKFSTLFIKGKDSKELQPTLYDFLCYRKIDILSSLLNESFNNNIFNIKEILSDSTIVMNDSLIAVDTVATDEFAVTVDTIAVDSVAIESIDFPESQNVSFRNSQLAPDTTSSIFETLIHKTYKELIDFRKNQHNDPAALYAELSYLKFNHNHSHIENRDSIYISRLYKLEKEYTNSESVIEVLALKANFYMIKTYDYRFRKVADDFLLNDSLKQQSKFKRIAYNICEEGIRRFPKYKRIDLLHNLKAIILHRSIDATVPNVAKPGSSVITSIRTSNVDTLKISVFKINDSAINYFRYHQANRNVASYPNRTLVRTDIVVPKKDYYFNTVETKYEFRVSDYGQYEMIVSANGAKESAIYSFCVTNLMHLQRDKSKKGHEIFVTDFATGKPLSDVKVSIYKSKWDYETNVTHVDSLTTSITDKSGYCSFDSLTESNYVLFLNKGMDNAYSINITNYGSNWRSGDEANKDLLKLDILTDRVVYRPGQSVYFKGIAYIVTPLRQEVVVNKTIEVKLTNVNNEQMSSKKFTTNEFGSFSGEFILPENGLNGEYTLEAGDYCTKQIFVEEYKRPTLETMIEVPKTEVVWGDSTHFKGSVKGFSGYSIAGAKVKYNITRSAHRLCKGYYPEEVVQTGTTTTNAEGIFDVSFIPKRSQQSVKSIEEQYFNYTLMVDVTDAKGETQHEEQSLSVGDKSLFISTDISSLVKKDTFTIQVTTATINDEPVNKVLNYFLYRLKENSCCNEDIVSDSVPPIDKEVIHGSFESKTGKLFLNLKQLKSGQYKLVLKTTDSQNREVKTEEVFILYSNKDKRPPVKVHAWLTDKNIGCNVGNVARVRFGTSNKDAYILYELSKGSEVIKQSWIRLTNECKTFEIPFLKEYGDGVTAMFTLVRNGKIYTQSASIVLNAVERTLEPKLSVFRDKLKPGEKTSWTVQIPGTDKKHIAELLVGMYDASLDKIARNKWFFQPVYFPNVVAATEWESYNVTQSDFGYSEWSEIKEVKDFQLDQLNWFGIPAGGETPRLMYGVTAMTKVMDRNSDMQRSCVKSSRLDVTNMALLGSSGVEPPPALRSSVKFTAPVMKDDVETSSVREESDATLSVNPDKIKLRTNFNETAFFYPQLRTDSTGNVKFTFTAPESLTRWNVKMLAHTPDLYFGQGEAQVVTQKDLMVQMNMPRFVRRSDKLLLSANVINLTDKALTAAVQFEMMDPATEKSIKLKDAAPKTVTLAANETKAVEWELTEFSPYELVICKAIAQAGNFSDGEQKYLPVLPDKVLVTESLPLTIRGNQTRTFSFESLLKNGSKVDTKNLSVEFSSNPAWYAVQALPTISTPEDDNALDYFTAYYANSLAAFIANSNPKIAATFDRWKKAGGSREALLSNLEKNAELKNMLLEETPWVMAAKDETEQKRQIALLFDINMQKNQGQQYLDKLLALQMPSGGFTWFKGMSESRYITQEILLNLGRLNRLTGKADANQQAAIASALRYLDLEMAHDFENLKKYNSNYRNEECVDNMQLFYLHLRSEFSAIPVVASAQEAVKFYTAQSEKDWTNFTLYGKAMMAVVANRNGKTQLANDILKSLKENALKTDEFGMYWAKNTSGYFWNERPIAVQAAIIEAFTEITKNTADIDELKIWLLKQKQTQRWDSPMATVDAIYALLNQGSDWLANEGSVKIKAGNKTLQPVSAEAGTGYFKETIPVAEVRSDMGKVTVNKTDKGIGWGAMYWQYYQDLDKIQGQGGPMKITKKLFVEKMTASGKTMMPIEQAELHKGDKVITRLVITTDRNLEFVALKDLRASCFEPVNQLSGCEWKENVCYYQTTKDASMQFFFSFLPKGTYVFEYGLWVNAAGEYTSGIAAIQCQYAPEFVSHTGGERIQIK